MLLLFFCFQKHTLVILRSRASFTSFGNLLIASMTTGSSSLIMSSRKRPEEMRVRIMGVHEQEEFRGQHTKTIVSHPFSVIKCEPSINFLHYGQFSTWHSNVLLPGIRYFESGVVVRGVCALVSLAKRCKNKNYPHTHSQQYLHLVGIELGALLWNCNGNLLLDNVLEKDV